MSDNQEKLSVNQESGIEVQAKAQEQLEKLSKSPENDVELSKRDIENRTEKARFEALNNAKNAEKKSKEAEKILKQSSTIRAAIGKKQREESFKKTLANVQNELPIGSRIFSKFTHNKAIEKTTEIIGGTIARPNAMLSGAFFAFIATLSVYLLAKNIGYNLSGFETIAAFAIGWIVGWIFDYLKIMTTGRKS